MSDWTIITKHGLVLVHLWKTPNSTAREIALAIKTTEWTVHKIIRELEAVGYIERQRVGRNNVYRLNTNAGLRHNITTHVMLEDLLKVLAPQESDTG